MAKQLTELSEQELRDLARQLEFDAENLIDRDRKRAANVQHKAVVDELRSRYARSHPIRTGITRAFAKLLRADTEKAERHLRSAGRDEI